MDKTFEHALRYVSVQDAMNIVQERGCYTNPALGRVRHHLHMELHKLDPERLLFWTWAILRGKV